MSAAIIDGKATAARLRADLAGDVAALAYRPGLAVVLVGEDPARGVYVRSKGEQPRAAFLVRRRDERESLRDEVTGLDRQIISPTVAESAVELLQHVLPGGTSTGALPPYPTGTEKYVVVTLGEVAVQLQGEEVQLIQGDVMFFEADVEHAFANRGTATCEYLLIVSRCLIPAPSRETD